MVKVVKMVKKNSMPNSYVTLKFSADARPGIQNFSKSTLPEANQLVRDLRELSDTLRGFSERLEQEGVGGALGPEKLPDYKPRRGQ